MKTSPLKNKKVDIIDFVDTIGYSNEGNLFKVKDVESAVKGLLESIYDTLDYYEVGHHKVKRQICLDFEEWLSDVMK